MPLKIQTSTAAQRHRNVRPSVSFGIMVTMMELSKICLTALFGVAIFVIGQIVQRFLIEPIQEQRKTVGQVAHAVTFLRNVWLIPNPENYLMPETPQNAIKMLRDLAAQLRMSLRMIPFYRQAARLNCVLKPEDVETAASLLIEWSNHMPDDQKLGRARRIEELVSLMKLNQPTKMTVENRSNA
jgi:hypothetical protein